LFDQDYIVNGELLGTGRFDDLVAIVLHMAARVFDGGNGLFRSGIGVKRQLDPSRQASAIGSASGLLVALR
jgi:hypothetical protein